MSKEWRQIAWRLAMMYILFLDFIFFNQIFGQVSLWWIHRGMEYWYLTHGPILWYNL